MKNGAGTGLVLKICVTRNNVWEMGGFMNLKILKTTRNEIKLQRTLRI